MASPVCNSSVLIHLAKIGLLDLLSSQFGSLLIPDAVWREVVEDGEGEADAEMVRDAEWIERRTLSPSALLRDLLAVLDAGEAEAIVLALESGSDVILLDEHDARQVARRQELHTVGVLGVLLRAKLQGDIDSVRERMDELVATGFRVSDALRSEILRSAGED